MNKYLAGYASHNNWSSLVEACLEQLGSIPVDAGLGFIYATSAIASDVEKIVTRLKSMTGINHWVGTVGLGICAGDTEYYDLPALAIMITDISEDQYRIFEMQSDPKVLLQSLNDFQKQGEFHSAIVHGDPRSAMTPTLINQLGQLLEPLFMTGGLSSAEGACPQIAGNITDGGISGVVFSDTVSIATTLSQGCTPISERHQVTGCNQNIVTQLDNRPAFDVFREDIGDILARDLNRLGGYIFAGFPVPGSDTGDYTVRNLMGINPSQQQIVIGDYVHEGQSILFCKRDGTSAWDDLREKLEKLKKRTRNPIKGGLYFSCLGRGRHLFGENSEEIRFIHEILGDFPLVGFFANGEIANNQLYGYTGVLTLFL